MPPRAQIIGRAVLSLEAVDSDFNAEIAEAERAALGLQRRFNRTASSVAHDASRMQRNVAAAGREIAFRFTAQLHGAGSALGKLGGAGLTVAAALGATTVAMRRLASATNAVHTAWKDYEFTLSRVTGLVGIARQQTELWSRDLTLMAGQIGVMPQELAEGLFFITSAGLREPKIAMDALLHSARASLGGLGELRVVADGVTSAMNAYASTMMSAEQATDVFVATVREGKIQPDALTAAVGRVLPLAAEMGVEFHEVGAALATFTRLGLNAEISVTALQALLAGFLKLAPMSSKELRKYGMSGRDILKVMRNEGLLAAMLEMRDAIEGNEVAMGRIIPNIRAIRGYLGLVGQNVGQTITIFKDMEDVSHSTTNAWEAAAVTVEGETRRIMGYLRGFQTELGRVFAQEVSLPLLNELREWLDEIGPAAFQAMARDWQSTLELISQFLVSWATITAQQVFQAWSDGLKARDMARMMFDFHRLEMVAINVGLWAQDLGDRIAHGIAWAIEDTFSTLLMRVFETAFNELMANLPLALRAPLMALGFSFGNLIPDDATTGNRGRERAAEREDFLGARSSERRTSMQSRVNTTQALIDAFQKQMERPVWSLAADALDLGPLKQLFIDFEEALTALAGEIEIGVGAPGAAAASDAARASVVHGPGAPPYMRGEMRQLPLSAAARILVREIERAATDIDPDSLFGPAGRGMTMTSPAESGQSFEDLMRDWLGMGLPGFGMPDAPQARFTAQAMSSEALVSSALRSISQTELEESIRLRDVARDIAASDADTVKWLVKMSKIGPTMLKELQAQTQALEQYGGAPVGQAGTQAPLSVSGAVTATLLGGLVDETLGAGLAIAGDAIADAAVTVATGIGDVLQNNVAPVLQTISNAVTPALNQVAGELTAGAISVGAAFVGFQSRVDTGMQSAAAELRKGVAAVVAPVREVGQSVAAVAGGLGAAGDAISQAPQYIHAAVTSWKPIHDVFADLGVSSAEWWSEFDTGAEKAIGNLIGTSEQWASFMGGDQISSALESAIPKDIARVVGGVMEGFPLSVGPAEITGAAPGAAAAVPVMAMAVNFLEDNAETVDQVVGAFADAVGAGATVAINTFSDAVTVGAVEMATTYKSASDTFSKATDLFVDRWDIGGRIAGQITAALEGIDLSGFEAAMYVVRKESKEFGASFRKLITGTVGEVGKAVQAFGGVMLAANPLELYGTALAPLAEGAAAWADTMKEIDITGFFAELVGAGTAPIASALGPIGDLLLGERIKDEEGEMTGERDLSTSILGPLATSPAMAPINALMQALGPLAGLGPGLGALQIAFESMVTVIQPLVQDVLRPLIGIFVIIGKIVGKLLAPVFLVLGAAAKVVGDIFTWLYNNVFRHVGNLILSIWNGIADVLNTLLGWAGVNLKKAALLEEMDTEVEGQEYIDKHATSSNQDRSKFEQQRPVHLTINAYNQGVLVGSGGMTEFVDFIVEEIDKDLDRNQ